MGMYCENYKSDYLAYFNEEILTCTHTHSCCFHLVWRRGQWQWWLLIVSVGRVMVRGMDGCITN